MSDEANIIDENSEDTAAGGEDTGAENQEGADTGADTGAENGADGAEKAKEGGDFLSGDDKEAAHPADWPKDWREKLADGDEKLGKQLSRMSSPQDLLKSYKALESKLSSGEYKKVSQLPDKPTEEELAAYRKENGIPDTWEGYDIKLEDGLVIGDDDKPIVDAFLQAMHEKNAPSGTINAALNAYYQLAEEEKQLRAEADLDALKDMEDELRAEYGAEYRKNQNILANYVDTLPEELGKNLVGARLANGKKLLSDPDAVRYFVNLAKEANPTITNFNGDTGEALKSIQEEIDGLKVGSPEYWKDQTKQDRYRELIELRDNLNAKQKRAG